MEQRWREKNQWRRRRIPPRSPEVFTSFSDSEDINYKLLIYPGFYFLCQEVKVATVRFHHLQTQRLIGREAMEVGRGEILASTAVGNKKRSNLTSETGN